MVESESSFPVTVIDVGARYGVHPSFAGLAAHRRYIAFEADAQEAQRLARKYADRPWYEVHAIAMGDAVGEATLKLLRHRGQSSLLAPNPDSAWFGATRVGEGDVEREVRVPMETLGHWCANHAVRPDFLKVDTEGFDFAVLRGASGLLRDGVLGVRCEVMFHPVFHGAHLFDEVFRLMVDHGFVLANLGYDGKGAHQSYFCPGDRWGLLTGCEAVFVRDPASLAHRDAVALVKYCIFCLLNDLPDLCHRVIEERQDLWPAEGDALRKDGLFDQLDLLFQQAANRLKYVPGDSYRRAAEAYRRYFGAEIADLHRFYESMRLNPR